MHVTRSTIINAPVAEVWKIAAHDFDKVDVWASGVSASGLAEGKAPNDEAVMAGRVCLTAQGKCLEMFEAYDEQRHTFTYKGLFEKSPPGLKSARNTWRVEAVSDAQARLSMSVVTELNLLPGLLVRLPLRWQLPRILDENLEEIKHYIETGEPHPRKIATLEKAAQTVSSLSIS